MKTNNDKDKKGLSAKDIVMIVLCIIALAALVLILQKSRKSEELQQQQLSEISEQIQQEGITSVGADKTSYAELVLNEVNQEGWIELYNSSKKDIVLKEFSLEVDGEQQQLAQEIQVPAGGLVVLEAGKALGAQEHTVLSLVSSEREKVCSLTIPALLEKESYGCTQDGTPEKSYQKPSKGESNKEENVILKEGMHFSVPGGFYEDTIRLEITAPVGTTVYYTLDGSTPTAESSLYQEAISIGNRSGSNYSYAAIVNNGYKPSSIAMGTVVRAIAVDGAGTVMEERTESYYIGLANNSDFANLPVISLTTDPVNLFDYFEGMYVPGKYYEEAVITGDKNMHNANYLQFWTKGAHIEYFEGNKNKTYSGSAQISMLRDYSLETPQKGFHVMGEVPGAWKGSGLYQYFDDVSNSLNIQANKRDNDSKAREYLANELLQQTSVGTADLTPCILFINGEYWGGYTLRAPFDKLYFENHYGITQEEVILAKEGYAENYDYRDSYEQLLQFATSNDLRIQQNYEQIGKMMDIQSYLDYFCANMYLANADYGIEEAYAWKTATVGSGEYADGRWRWIVGKLDNAMDTPAANEMATCSINTYLLPAVREDVLLRALMQNDTFRQQLKATMKRMAEEVFEPQKVSESLTSISQRISKMATSSYERFYAYSSTSFYSEQEKRIIAFFEERGYYMLRYTDELDKIEEKWAELENDENSGEMEASSVEDDNVEENQEEGQVDEQNQ